MLCNLLYLPIVFNAYLVYGPLNLPGLLCLYLVFGPACYAYLVSYAYLHGLLCLPAWSPMPGLLGLYTNLLSLPRHLSLPMVSYAYTYIHESPMPIPNFLGLPNLLCLPRLLSLSIWSPMHLHGLLCLPSLLSLPIVSYAYL